MSARRLRLAGVLSLAVLGLAACATGSNGRTDGPSSRPPLTSAPTTAPATSPDPPGAVFPTVNPAPTISVHAQGAPSLPAGATTTATSPPTRHSSPAHPANPLPLKYSTGSATQLITVTATSSSSTDARLQRWTRSGSTWLKVGSSIHAYLGRSGTSTDKHEGDGNTPSGSFTMTEAFGYNSNPGTKLSYFQTDSEDWWISQPGSLYNTHQRCSSTCRGGLHPASPSEHLVTTVPNYRYAVVIDYNTARVYPKGSAVFLHVQTGKPTSGCVSIDSDALVAIMRWLQPTAHPRILIGVG